MNLPSDLEHCLSFIHCQLQPSATPAAARKPPVRVITISRQSGCGAHVLAQKLAALLQSQARPESPPWRVFDRDLVERVLEDHQLPKRLARFMPEDRVRQTEDMIDELFGLHPPSEVLVQQTAETILKLAETGNVILVGRGANVITAKLPCVFHVRLIGTFARRVEQMIRFEGLSEAEAANRVRREDLGRQRYVRKHFGHDVDDPLLYHLVINMDTVSLDDAARWIAIATTTRESAAD